MYKDAVAKGEVCMTLINLLPTPSPPQHIHVHVHTRCAMEIKEVCMLLRCGSFHYDFVWEHASHLQIMMHLLI